MKVRVLDETYKTLAVEDETEDTEGSDVIKFKGKIYIANGGTRYERHYLPAKVWTIK